MLTTTRAHASAASPIPTCFEAHEYDFSGDLATILPESVTTKATCTLTAALLKVFRQHAIANGLSLVLMRDKPLQLR